MITSMTSKKLHHVAAVRPSQCRSWIDYKLSEVSMNGLAKVRSIHTLKGESTKSFLMALREEYDASVAPTSNIADVGDELGPRLPVRAVIVSLQHERAH